jgi:hypothetical protein
MRNWQLSLQTAELSWAPSKFDAPNIYFYDTAMSLSKPCRQRVMMQAYYAAKLNEVKLKGGEEKELVYKNQKEAAVEICRELFDKGKTIATLIAEPQVGKTGTFLETAFLACTHQSDTHIVDPSNIFIITGMSDTDWQKQTKNDMLEPFKKRVYHRGRLNTQDRQDGFYTNLANAKDALLIFDECHIANGKEHQISGMLRTLGLLDLSVLKQRNIKILDVSATPGATLNDTLTWGEENHSVIILKSSEAYTGFRHFIKEKRIHESYDLTDEIQLESLARFIKSTFPNPLWHVIRLPSKSRKNSELDAKISCICAREKWTAMNHSAVDRINDLDYHMGTRPKTHTFLLIKEFWRAGKRLNDTFIGIVHDAPTEDVNVAAQGLAGRLCGNDKKRGADAPHVFTNTELINQYIAWIDAKGDFSKVRKYNSAQLTIKNGRVKKSRKTFAHEDNVLMDDTTEQTDTDPEFDHGYSEFKTQDENDVFAMGHGARRSVKYENDTEGFQICSTGESPHRCSYEEIKKLCSSKNYSSNLDKNIDNLAINEYAHRRYVCYKDTKDINSVVYITRWVKRLREFAASASPAAH